MFQHPRLQTRVGSSLQLQLVYRESPFDLAMYRLTYCEDWSSLRFLSIFKTSNQRRHVCRT